MYKLRILKKNIGKKKFTNYLTHKVSLFYTKIILFYLFFKSVFENLNINNSNIKTLTEAHLGK